MKIHTGQLNQVIKIQQLSTVADDYGSNIETYTDFKTIRAKAQIDRGYRVVVNDEIVYQYSITFYIRNQFSLNESMRIIYNGKKYRIISLVEDNDSIIITTELINE